MNNTGGQMMDGSANALAILTGRVRRCGALSAFVILIQLALHGCIAVPPNMASEIADQTELEISETSRIEFPTFSVDPPSGLSWSSIVADSNSSKRTFPNADRPDHEISLGAEIHGYDEGLYTEVYTPFLDTLALRVIQGMNRSLIVPHSAIRRYELELVQLAGTLCARGKAEGISANPHGALPPEPGDDPMSFRSTTLVSNTEFHFLACTDPNLGDDEFIFLRFFQSTPEDLEPIEVDDAADQFFDSLQLLPGQSQEE